MSAPRGARPEVVATATTYLDALLSHDARSARLGTGVRRVANGRQALEGDDAVRAVIAHEPVGAIGSLDWVVDGDTAAALYDLDADMTRVNGIDDFGPRERWIPAYVAERFRVVDGAIAEIELVHAATAVGTARPPRPERYPRGRGDAAPSRDQLVAAASAYLDALVSHDASAVPLAPQAWRVENGRNSGDSGAEIARALEADIMGVVTGVRDLVWCVEDDTAIVFYTLDVDLGRLPNVLTTGDAAGSETSAKRLGERFRVHDGLLAEIEVVIPADDM
ncbi:MAG TPA: hypothetical protein VH986_06365 [Acidimicrobiia bacterium]